MLVRRVFVWRWVCIYSGVYFLPQSRVIALPSMEGKGDRGGDGGSATLRSSGGIGTLVRENFLRLAPFPVFGILPSLFRTDPSALKYAR